MTRDTVAAAAPRRRGRPSDFILGISLGGRDTTRFKINVFLLSIRAFSFFFKPTKKI